MKPEKQSRKFLEFFNLVELYAVKIISTIIFLVFLYVTAHYEITHLLAK
jgi:hypothetical protein